MCWTGLYPLILFQVLVKLAEASGCSKDQIQSCKDAATSDNISESPGGGVCQPKSYVHFTHLCTVTNYVPSIKHCCCAQAEQVFCCRYHYDWNYFRCVEADDTIHFRTSNIWPQEILLTVILVPSVSGLCCMICCVRCLCCHGENEEERTCCCSKCVSKCMSRDTSHHSKPDGEVEIPLRFTESKTEKQYPTGDAYIPQSHSGALYSSVPSAPPVETSNNDPNHPGDYPLVTSGHTIKNNPDHTEDSNNDPNLPQKSPFFANDHIRPNSRLLVHYVVLETDAKLIQDLNPANKSPIQSSIQSPIYPQVDMHGYPQVEIKQIGGHCGDLNNGSVVRIESTNYGQSSDLPLEPPQAYDGLQQNDETPSSPVHTIEARSS